MRTPVICDWNKRINVEYLRYRNVPSKNLPVADNLRELMRAHQRRKAEEQLETLLLEGLQGEDFAFTRAEWQVIRQKLWPK